MSYLVAWIWLLRVFSYDIVGWMPFVNLQGSSFRSWGPRASIQACRNPTSTAQLSIISEDLPKSIGISYCLLNVFSMCVFGGKEGGGGGDPLLYIP